MAIAFMHKYPLLSLDEIIRIKSEELTGQIKGLETTLLPMQDKLSAFLKIQSRRDGYRQRQEDLSKKKARYNQQESELKQYMAEIGRGEAALPSLKAELSRLETKRFQTGQHKAENFTGKARDREGRRFMSRQAKCCQIAAKQASGPFCGNYQFGGNHTCRSIGN